MAEKVGSQGSGLSRGQGRQTERLQAAVALQDLSKRGQGVILTHLLDAHRAYQQEGRGGGTLYQD
jgi:hypothetical protein